MMSKEALELWQRVKKLSLSDQLWLQLQLASSIRRTIAGPKWEEAAAAEAAALAADPELLHAYGNSEDFLPLDKPAPEQLP